MEIIQSKGFGEEVPPELSSISTLIQSADFPVYGLKDNPYNLYLHGYGFSKSGQHHQLNSVNLGFSKIIPPSYSQFDFALSSSNALLENHPDSSDIYTLKDTYKPVRIFRKYNISLKELEQVKDPTIFHTSILINEIRFSAKFVQWNYPFLLVKFLLKAEKTVLSGEIRDLTYQEIVPLFETLQIVDDNPTLLQQYQRDQELCVKLLRGA